MSKKKERVMSTNEQYGVELGCELGGQPMRDLTIGDIVLSVPDDFTDEQAMSAPVRAPIPEEANVEEAENENTL